VNQVNLDPEFKDHVAQLAREVRIKFADAVVRDAVRFAPVLTGELKSSISRNADGTQVRANVDHAAPVEFGHRIVDREGNDTGKRVPPQPYLRPAAYRARGSL
jgi:hypothetical protein